MKDQIFSRHAKRIERADHAALLFDPMDDKHGDHIGEQDHNDDACDQSREFVDLLIVRRRTDSRIFIGGKEKCEVVRFYLKISIKQFVGLLF